jgi:Cysteine-rich secretory protein family
MGLFWADIPFDTGVKANGSCSAKTMKLVKRILSVAFSGLLALSAFGGVAVLGSSVAHADVVLDEARFLQRINADRAASGAPALLVLPRLVDIARSWSRLLSERTGSSTECVLSHNQNLLEVLRPASRVAENVGCGDASADALHDAFMNSPQHRNNILDPSFDSVGIGVFMSGDTMFVSVEFVRSVVTAPVTLVPLPVLVPVPPSLPATKLSPVVKPRIPGIPAKSKAPAKVAPKSLAARPASKKLSSVAPKSLSKAPALQSSAVKKGVNFALRAKRISRLFRAEARARGLS